MKLYELTDQLKGLQQLADTDESIDITDTLQALEGEFSLKADGIAKVLAIIDGDTETVDAEIERLKQLKSAKVARKEKLKDYLRMNMEAADIKKIQCPLFTITLVEGREIATVTDESKLPDEYVTVKTDISPNKNAIAQALKDGIEVPGAHLERAKSSIRIK